MLNNNKCIELVAIEKKMIYIFLCYTTNVKTMKTTFSDVQNIRLLLSKLKFIGKLYEKSDNLENLNLNLLLKVELKKQRTEWFCKTHKHTFILGCMCKCLQLTFATSVLYCFVTAVY